MPLNDQKRKIIDELIFNDTARIVARLKPSLRLYVCSFIRTQNRCFNVPELEFLELVKQGLIELQSKSNGGFCSEFWMLTNKARMAAQEEKGSELQ